MYVYSICPSRCNFLSNFDTIEMIEYNNKSLLSVLMLINRCVCAHNDMHTLKGLDPSLAMNKHTILICVEIRKM